jgi:hypothetical protein
MEGSLCLALNLVDSDSIGNLNECETIGHVNIEDTLDPVRYGFTTAKRSGPRGGTY